MALRITGLYMLYHLRWRGLKAPGFHTAKSARSKVRSLPCLIPAHFCGCWNAPRSFIATAKRHIQPER